MSQGSHSDKIIEIVGLVQPKNIHFAQQPATVSRLKQLPRKNAEKGNVRSD